MTIVEGSVPMPEMAILADDDGRFSLRLPPGRFTLRAHAGDAAGQAEMHGPPVAGETVIVLDD